jgi:hypothetical protein
MDNNAGVKYNYNNAGYNYIVGYYVGVEYNYNNGYNYIVKCYDSAGYNYIVGYYDGCWI